MAARRGLRGIWVAAALILGACGADADPSAATASAATSAAPSGTADPGPGEELIAFARSHGDGPGTIVLRDLASGVERPVAAPEGSRPLAFTLDRAMLLVAEPPDTEALTTHLALYPVDGTDPVSLVDTFAIYAEPAPSPDGRYLAFSSDGAAPNGIVIVDLERGVAWQHTTDGAKGSPRWSPDGRWIAYEAFHQVDGQDRFQNDAFVVELVDGAAPRAITNDEFNDTPLGWTDGGGGVVIWTDRGTAQTKLSFTSWTIDLVAGDAERRPDLAANGPITVASPDGRWDAVFSFAGFLELQPTDGASVDRRVLERDTDAGMNLSWAPTGGWLVWNARVDGVLDLFMVRVPDGEPANLTRTPDADEWYPVWGPAYHGS